MKQLSHLKNNIDDFLLCVDSSNPDFQFIHIDVTEQYGITCKFEFSEKRKDYFRITDIKMIEPNGGKTPLQFKVKINKNCRELVTSNFSFMIDIELTKTPGVTSIASTGDDIKDFCHKFKRKTKGSPTVDYRIDVHIINKPNSLYKFLATEDTINFGNQFCKFYIV